MNKLLRIQSTLLKFPFGKYFFSKAVARMAPYFQTIKPTIDHLEHNRIRVSMRKRPSVQNHINTVHAIACCNLCELAAGICMEASIPNHRRWIPRGMEVAYVAKADNHLIASCDLNGTDWDNCDEVPCYVSVKTIDGKEVVTATIYMKVSDKRK